MGWFLTTKKKPRPRRRTRGLEKAKPWDPQRTLLGLKVLGAIAAVGCLAWAWQAGEPRLRAYATELAAKPSPDRPTGASSVHVRLVDAPPWMEHGGELRRQITSLVARHISPDPLGSEDLNRAVRELQQCAWIARVERVERTAIDKIEVRAEYREPAALVRVEHPRNRSDAGYHLIDTEGVRLIGTPYRDRAACKLPVITAVAHAEPCPVGDTWPGEDVQAALKLVRLLETRPYYDQVDGIEILAPDQLGRVSLKIIATNGGEIRWGLAPGAEQVAEISADRKLAILDHYHRTNETIVRPGATAAITAEVIFER